MKLVPHGEPYAGKLHVRFDEGAGVPHGASRSTLHPYSSSEDMRSARLPTRSRLHEVRSISSQQKRPTTKCRATSVRSSTSPSATSSRAASSTDTAAGCGTSGKASGTAA